MGYPSLEACLLDLEKQGHLIRIKEEVDPYLEMASIHLRIHEQGGPAILFENVKGTSFRCASNIFGTLERSKYIFRDSLEDVKRLIALKNNPMSALKNPLKNINAAWTALNALPLKRTISKPVLYQELKIEDLPLIHHWKMDGGAFVTLPQVYSEDVDKPGIMNANLGMYRIQLSGNEYVLNEEIGLHYQLHRGIGVHQTKAAAKGVPLKVSCFVGGPPSHTVAAVMPLPEGMSEMTFAGALGKRRFRYGYHDGYAISYDADFVISGEVVSGTNKPEGPFGDHLGYYSLQHPFPVMRVHKVYAKKNAIWPFTVVGRPPQEDTSFGALIHEIAGDALPYEIPGLKEVNAVDAAGVHPLLLAIGSERYTPYLSAKRPQELLTIANHILGKGQLSLAKFLFITADPSNTLNTHHIQDYFQYVLSRIDLANDIHFYTRTTIDTLDYSGEDINAGSKVVIAAYGDVKRTLAKDIPPEIHGLKASVVMPGIIAIQALKAFDSYEDNNIQEIKSLLEQHKEALHGFPFIIYCDDADFLSAHINNFLWTSFTRCNPSHDIHGLQERWEHKHWSCTNLIIDARSKPHHAPPLVKDEAVEKRVDAIMNRLKWPSPRAL